MTVEFGLLGGVEVRADGRLVDLRHPRQRLLLAALLVDFNHTVSIDQLAERIWGERIPRRARGTLYSYLSRLRQALATAGGVEITRHPTGYALTADAATVDLYRFRDLVAQAREAKDDERAAELLGQALGLWRGEALAGMDTVWAGAVREGLRQERLAAELDQVEVRLRLGEHVEVLPGLRAWAKENLGNERLARQVMLALYRCGRTAEALGHYQDTHRALAGESGTDPGPELQRLYQRILDGDPALAPGADAVSGGTAVPRQLPAPPPLFTGRGRELAALTAALEGDRGRTVVVSAIGGAGGVGKTYLALYWAHNHLECFPDGQLYVNLRGFDPVSPPVPPSVALRGFLDALGVEPAAIPTEPEAQIGLYRSLVADKRALILLDNARDTAQILSLLPGNSDCTVVVTSRHQLTGLTVTHAAKPLALDALPQAEARQLLARHLSEDRLAAEPRAVTAILDRCAGLPLALGIVAARAAAQPDFSLARLAEELTKAEDRLDALDTGDLTVNLRAIFTVSYRTLEVAAARAFALLGLAPGSDISLLAAASLLGLPLAVTRRLLRTLQTVHLVRQHIPGRYQLHDLVRLFAAERAAGDYDEDTRTAALRRLADFYLHTAHHASALLRIARAVEVVLDPPVAGCTPHRAADAAAAREWFTAEDTCLLAVHQLTHDQGWHTLTWQLSATMINFRFMHGYRPEDLRMWQTALKAADRLRDPTAQAITHYGQGSNHCLTGHYDEAHTHLSQALALFEHAGHLPGQADTHYTLGWLRDQQGDPQGALSHSQRALRLFQDLGDTKEEEANTLNAIGWIHAQRGRHEQARGYCERALALCRIVGDRNTEAVTLDSLGYIAHHGGQHHQALDFYQQALAMCREVGYAWMEAEILEHLGETHQVLDQPAAAHQLWRQALDIYQIQHRTADAARVQERLAALDTASADPPER